MKHIIIGYGQIGQLIHALLKETKQEVWYRDLKACSDGAFDIVSYDYMHVCIPYTDKFKNQLQEYIDTHNPKTIIIHSTVKVGTTDSIKFSGRKVYSPVNGRHDNGFLEDVKKYIKYFSCEPLDEELIEDIESMFNLTCEFIEDNRSLEFAKLNCTTSTLEMIAYEKNLFEYCQRNRLNYGFIYRRWNENYNQGVRPEWRKPIYEHKDGFIGGHCLVPNLELLPNDYENGRIAKIKAERWK
jgi:hypothetical protein